MDVLGNILGRKVRIVKDKYGRNMAITEEEFKKKFNKFETGVNTGADVQKLFNYLSDEQLAKIMGGLKSKAEIDEILKPFGLSGNPEHFDTWVRMQGMSIQHKRERGELKEKSSKK